MITEQQPTFDSLPLCLHQFFELDEAKEYGVKVYGIRVMCANCGEWRLLQFDGKIMGFDKEKKVWEELI